MRPVRGAPATKQYIPVTSAAPINCDLFTIRTHLSATRPSPSVGGWFLTAEIQAGLVGQQVRGQVDGGVTKVTEQSAKVPP